MIEVVTTVSDMVNKPVASRRPICYDSRSEIYSSDEDDLDSSAKNIRRLEIIVHSKHISKWPEQEYF